MIKEKVRTTKLKHRLIALEKFGMRSEIDFQPAALAMVKDAGFTGVLVNGGAGMGPDMMPPESLAAAEPLAGLFPLTTAANRLRIHGRCRMLRERGLEPWLLFWGVPGPDESANSLSAESNRLFDRRSKLEMTALMRRRPEIFGCRSPRKVSWRGSRPLCLSHPLVREFYSNLAGALARDEEAGYAGVIFFPGDSDPEMCDEHCPRCAASGRGRWEIMAEHVNRLYAALQSGGGRIPFYFCLWNQHLHGGLDNIRSVVRSLSPGMGICMSISDGVVQERRGGRIAFDQPWCNVIEPGELFSEAAKLAEAESRPFMVFGEIAQSEVWDPVCHNMPLPAKTLGLLKNAEAAPAVDGICDFWGHRHPFLPHANFSAMRSYFQGSAGDAAGDLRTAARWHYAIPEAREDLTDVALGAWEKFDRAVDRWALLMWGQRFSFAIGRAAARGRTYGPLIPPVLGGRWLKCVPSHPSCADIAGAEHFLSLQKEDQAAFAACAGSFDSLSGTLSSAGCESAAFARREAANIRLASELIVSEARFLLAIRLFAGSSWERLREIVLEELDARERQLVISGACGEGAGVDPALVEEDIQNMRLFLSAGCFPNVPDNWFQLTPCPYTL